MSANVRIVVDRDRCEANAVCMKTAPEVFKVDDKDVMHVLVERPGDAVIDKVKSAVRRCPKQALTLVED
jgi:ferredoxin